MAKAKGPHQWLSLEVIWPESETDPGDHAEAISREVFEDFAKEPQNIISLPRVVGGMVLRKGHMLQAFGNTKAHNAAEVALVDLELLDD
jgi:hypothetical protein